MPIKHQNLQLTRLSEFIPVWEAEIAPHDLPDICRQVHEGGGRLLALWGSDECADDAGFRLHVALLNASGMVCLHVGLDAENPVYPDISYIFPAASRMQRATNDLLGFTTSGIADARKWLRHGAWQGHPLRKDYQHQLTHEMDHYPFVKVEGDGVHEIPVGPVHAGIIEPGHFRFSIVGEKVLKLEERLGYLHKGIEKRFEQLPVEQATKLAGRISGDSTVAYAWSFAMALEGMTHTTPSDEALWMRALLLERERIANHLGDLGYLGNDVALAFGFHQFWILKEQVLRLNAELFGHRYLMDQIVPGGVARGLPEGGKERLLAECEHLEREVKLLRTIYDEHAGVQDRYIGAGRVAPKLAAQLGLCGLPGRASAQSWDARVMFACAPYDKLEVNMATHRNGDVAARVAVRFDEVFESLRLQRRILTNLLGGDEWRRPLRAMPQRGFGLGVVEGWRGEVMLAVHTDAHGQISRVHPHDPSWQNWPVLEHAIMDNIVPDFPLINKSFNLSYSGPDL